MPPVRRLRSGPLRLWRRQSIFAGACTGTAPGVSYRARAGLVQHGGWGPGDSEAAGGPWSRGDGGAMAGLGCLGSARYGQVRGRGPAGRGAGRGSGGGAAGRGAGDLAGLAEDAGNLLLRVADPLAEQLRALPAPQHPPHGALLAVQVGNGGPCRRPARPPPPAHASPHHWHWAAHASPHRRRHARLTPASHPPAHTASARASP